MKQLTPHFHESEFQCTCGCHLVEPLKREFVNRLEKARMYAMIAFHINSGVRCKAHNAKVGGVDSSAHLNGYAVDIRCDSNMDRFIINKALVDAGFNRIGIAHSYIHVDCDPNKVQNTEWVY